MYDDEVDWSDSSIPPAKSPKQLAPEVEQWTQDRIDETFEEYESAQPQDQAQPGWHSVQPEPLAEREDSAADSQPPAVQPTDGSSQQPDTSGQPVDLGLMNEEEMHDVPPEETSSADGNDIVEEDMPDAAVELEEGEIYEPPLPGRSRHESPRYLDRWNRIGPQERCYYRPMRQYPPEAMQERGHALVTDTPSSVLVFLGLGGSDTAVDLLRVALQLVAAPLERGPTGLLPTNIPTSARGAPRGSMRRVLLVRDREREWSVSYGFAEFASVDDARQALHRARLERPLNRFDWPVWVNFAAASAFRAGPDGLEYDDEDTFVEELVLPTSGTAPQATGGAESEVAIEEPAVEEEGEVGGGAFKPFAFPKRARVPEEE